MREIKIETSESSNHHRKNLSIVELIRQDGMIARAEKKFSYYVFEQGNALPPADLHNWVESQSSLPTKKERHVSIKKIFDNKTGKGQMAYRVIGSFYVVQNLHVFTVVFMHCIKFDMVTKKEAA